MQITGQIYEPYDFTLNVKNNFPTEATFNIEVIPCNTKLQTKNLFCVNSVVKIKKDETVMVPFVFFPFALESHKFQILFKDPKVGEFQYDLTGLVDMPQVTPESIRLTQTFFTNKTYQVEISVPPKN